MQLGGWREESADGVRESGGGGREGVCVCVGVCVRYLCRQKFALLPERQVKCRSSPYVSDSERRRRGGGEDKGMEVWLDDFERILGVI